MTGITKKKPLALHLHDGNKNKLSTEDKEAYAAAEITMGDLHFITPPDVRNNQLAMRKWREVIKIYRDAGLTVVSNTDTGVIARYCILYAEYWELEAIRDEIKEFKLDNDDKNELMAESDAEFSRERARRLWNLMDYFTRLDGLLKLDDKIHRKLKTILDIEDRIFLNPAAKVRTLPIKRKAKEKDELGDLGFDV